jgi:hypothetical protein
LPRQAQDMSRLIRSIERKTPFFFECFPYVCPEPVLVKRSFLYINGRFRLCAGAARGTDSGWRQWKRRKGGASVRGAVCCGLSAHGADNAIFF